MPPAKTIPPETMEALEPLPAAWMERLGQTMAWSPEIIQRFDLRVWQDPTTGVKRIAIPVQDHQGRLVNLRLFRPDDPDYPYINYADPDGERHGGLRLFPHPSRWLNSSEAVVLVPSEAEALAGQSHGLETFCTTGPVEAWKSAFDRQLRGLDVLLAFPADKQGQDAAEEIAGRLAAQARSVAIIEWPPDMDHTPTARPATGGPGLIQFLLMRGPFAADELLEELPRREVKGPPPPDMGALDQGLVRLRAFSAADQRTTFRVMLLVDEIRRETPLLTDRDSGVTYRYNGRVWRPCKEEELQALASNKLAMASKLNQVREVASLLRVKSLLPEGEGMNCSPNMVCCANGMVNLTTWEVEPHDPRHRATYLYPWAFTPGDPPPCERFLRYLGQAVPDPEVIRELIQFTGYVIWPHQPFKKALFLIGPGDSGKSLFLSILQALVGTENCAALDLDDLSNEFMRAQLRDRALNVYPEADSKFFESRIFKALTGGDQVTASFKHRDPFEFNFWGKMAFSMNRFPRVADDNEAFWARVLPVRFPHQFKGKDRDSGLKDKLLAELPGIFHLAVVGLAELLAQDGFAHCQATLDTLEACQRDTNPILGFMEECCTTRPELGDKERPWVKKSELYTAYKEWARANGFGTTNRANFLNALQQIAKVEDYRAPEDADGKRAYALRGVRLLSAMEKDA